MFLTPSARRRARFLAISFLLVLGTGLLLSTAWQVYHRSAFAHTVLSYRFEYGEEPVTLPGSGQFHDGVPLEEMDFQALGYVPDDNMRRAERYPVESCPFLDDVTYYRRENGRMVRALTLKKGTLLPCEDPNLTRNPKFGYGFYSYPTYEAGWRYAVPFTSEAVVSGWEKGLYVLPQTEYDYYYVRLEDLKPVVAAAYKALGEKGTPRSVRSTTLLFDEGLVRHNTFISADLRASIFPAQYLPNFTAAALCLLAAFLLFRAQLKHPR